MVDTIRTDAANLALLADNTAGAISPQDVRDAYVSLAAKGWTSVKQFGAVGNGSTDDRAALQAAINSELPLYLPSGTYLISAPLIYNVTTFMRGAGANTGSGGPRSVITGNFAPPLLYRSDGSDGGYTDHNNAFVGTTAIGVSCGIVLEDLVLNNPHAQGSCLQTFNLMAPIMLSRCRFEFDFRGVILQQCFNAFVLNCKFNSNSSTTRINNGTALEAVGLFMGGHSTAIGCDFQGCGTAIRAINVQSNVYSARIEICGYGMQLGGISLSGETIGVNTGLSKATISGISMEANHRNLLISNLQNAVDVSNISIQGSVGGPVGMSEYGVFIGSAGDHTVRIANITGGGEYTQAGVIVQARGAFDGLNGFNSASGGVGIGGLGTVFDLSGANAQIYSLRRFPLNPSLNAAQPDGHETVTVFSDMQLRGIKGLDIANVNVLPNNLGRIETVTEGATTKAVAFAPSTAPSDATMTSLTAVSGSGPAAGTYDYTSTLIGPRGETGVNAAANTKQVVLGSGQVARIVLAGVSSRPHLKRRIYRRLSSVVGRYAGFFEAAVGTTSIDDTNVSLTLNDLPPPDGYSIPAETELDASYAVVATPSWGTTCWVTSKATSGFTLNFGTAAPAGASVQWLLFRS